MERMMKRARSTSEVSEHYLNLVRQYPPLTREEEHEVALRARKGDVAAKHKLVQHSLAYVIVIARHQRRGSLPLEDIIQEGNLGLLRAVEKFDPNAGTRFLTYAAWWIRAFIGRHMLGARSSVRQRAGTVAVHDVSLDASPGDEESSTFLDQLEDEGPGPEKTAELEEARVAIRKALRRGRKRIGDLGWDIVQSRLATDSPQTLEEIGNRWEISRERVRQLEVRTRQFLERYLEPLKEAA